VSPASAGRDEAIRALVLANRILANEGTVDAFGHVSVRDPEDAQHYLMSRSRAPELVAADDIMAFTLEGDVVDPPGRPSYSERMIHGAVYEARPDVRAVVHLHAREVVAFSTATPGTLRVISHITAAIGNDIPTWDIAEEFGDTDMLVTTMGRGRDLARALGSGRVVLMRGHGAVIAADDIRIAVNAAIYLRVNAIIQLDAMRLGAPTFLTPQEVDLAAGGVLSPLALDRAWEYWATRAGLDA
jgi:HCOMODA/2-hydroxy-3-carboxy-muconic semialdehyde decarboxylase